MSVEEIIIQLREIQRSNGRIFDQQFFASNKAIDNAIRLLNRPKGKWIKNEYGWYYHCSVCKENNLLHTDEANALSDYCPNCGADMRGEE